MFQHSEVVIGKEAQRLFLFIVPVLRDLEAGYICYSVASQSCINEEFLLRENIFWLCVVLWSCFCVWGYDGWEPLHS